MVGKMNQPIVAVSIFGANEKRRVILSPRVDVDLFMKDELNCAPPICFLFCRPNLSLAEFQTEVFEYLLRRVLFTEIINERVGRERENYFSVFELRQNRPNCMKRNIRVAKLVENKNCPVAPSTTPDAANDRIHAIDEHVIYQRYFVCQ